MKLIKVNRIDFQEKDIIEIANEKDFQTINEQIFADTFVYDLEGVWYLIGEQVAYCFNKNNGKRKKG